MLPDMGDLCKICGKKADSSQLIFSLTLLLLGNHAPKMTSKEKSKLKKISLKKLNTHINLFHFGADLGQVHHMFSQFLNLRIYDFFFHEIFFALFFYSNIHPELDTIIKIQNFLILIFQYIIF